MVAEQFYKKFITQFVKQQMILLGPTLAVDTVNRVEGLEVNSRGQVVQIVGDYPSILQATVEEFSRLSQLLTTHFLHLLFTQYPQIAAEYQGPMHKPSLVCSLIKPKS
ncbi:hypothetical protein IPM19_01505 [bacterium]|nr:MAG: hypothetical protein IPM19_01505 [bacterium]